MKVNSHLRPHVLCLASQSVENVEIKAKYDESQSKVQTLQNQVISLQVWPVFGGCVLLSRQQYCISGIVLQIVCQCLYVSPQYVLHNAAQFERTRG